MTPEERLRELGHALPTAPKSVANYVGLVQTGNLLFLSGKGPDLAGGSRQCQGMVNSAPDFTDQPKVINGASDLLVEIFGELGRHARSAVGMASLPGGIPVEIEMIVELAD